MYLIIWLIEKRVADIPTGTPISPWDYSLEVPLGSKLTDKRTATVTLYIRIKHIITTVTQVVEIIMIETRLYTYWKP